MRDTIEKLVGQALRRLVEDDVLEADAIPARVGVERTRDPQHGDFATNVAMTMARAARTNPRQLAQKVVAALPDSAMVERVEIAGPGFINFHLTRAARHAVVENILQLAGRYGHSSIGTGQAVLVEFVSANPTGPLHVGHGRHAAYGDSVARLLEATGHKVQREYYVNDAGRQMDILALSLWLRYLQLSGEQLEFPAAGYQGEYIAAIASQLRDQHGSRLVRPAQEVFDDTGALADDPDRLIDKLVSRCKKLLGETDYRVVADTGLEAVLDDIRADLEEFGVHFDRWFSERELVEKDLVGDALDALRDNGDLYEKDGATWFRASHYGDEKDRVVIRENGQTTYIASDIAYHYNKRNRGMDTLLDVLGSDHHGYVARVRAGLEALGQPPESLEVRLMQFVTLYRSGEKEQMSTRSGNFITLRELRDDVGNDAARLFYVMRSNDQHLNFDIDLARSRSEDNPVFYIQYAHARICNVFAKLAGRQLQWDRAAGLASLQRLDQAAELELLGSLSRYPEVVELAATNRAPHHLVHYLRELAAELNSYYNDETLPPLIRDEDAPRRNARLSLFYATRQTLANGLGLLGVSAPESM